MDANLKKEIASEIALSEFPGKTLKKWRNIFNVPQAKMAEMLDVNRTVVSDYERGRRNPKLQTIKKFIDALDQVENPNISYITSQNSLPSSILDRNEFKDYYTIQELVKSLNGHMLYESHKKFVFGYTMIDSIKAILELGWVNFFELYGKTTQRVLLFTSVEYGRSPMIAVRVHPLKPAAVIYISPKKVDKLSIKLAMMEDIPFAVTNMNVDDIKKVLRRFV